MQDLRTLAQFQGSEMSAGLFQSFMDGHIKLKTLHISGEHSAVAMSARLNPMGSQSSIPVLRNLCSGSAGA